MASEEDEEKDTAELSAKQIAFCEQYVVDWNGSRAARAAGYSERSAKEMASTLLTKHNIKAHIEFLKTDTARLAGVSLLRNVQELTKIAYSSIAHLHDTWIERKQFEELTEDQKSAIESIETKVEIRTMKVKEGEDIDTEIHYVKVKLYDKMKAIDTINRMLGYNAPKKMELEVNELSPEERQRRLDELKRKLG